MVLVSVASATASPRAGPGSRGCRLPAEQKADRDRAIVIDRNKGIAWPVIAQRYDLQERQCREIFNQWRASTREWEHDLDPVAWLHDTFDRYESLISSFALNAERADNAAARVGALRGQMEAMTRQIELMIASGLLPRALRQEIDVRQVSATIVQVLKEHGTSNETLAAIQQALRVRGSSEP